MLVDMDEVRKHIKPKAHSTLCNMRKADLIDYIRCLEHNYNVAVSFNENQARYIESLDAVEVIRCKDCRFYETGVEYYPDGTKDVCRLLKRQMLEDGFCSVGERRTDVLPVR